MDFLKGLLDDLREDWKALTIGVLVQASLQSLPLLALLFLEGKALDRYRESAFLAVLFWLIVSVFIATHVYNRAHDKFQDKRRQLC